MSWLAGLARDADIAGLVQGSFTSALLSRVGVTGADDVVPAQLTVHVSANSFNAVCFFCKIAGYLSMWP